MKGAVDEWVNKAVGHAEEEDGILQFIAQLQASESTHKLITSTWTGFQYVSYVFFLGFLLPVVLPA